MMNEGRARVGQLPATGRACSASDRFHARGNPVPIPPCNPPRREYRALTGGVQ